ncbi:MAG: hypothetical protein NC401_04250, partial [Ruminococcus sp.]|nr:hypothetical protein [Ruminococcus sp.]
PTMGAILSTSSNLVLSAISLARQAFAKFVHENVHETTPKVTFPGSFFVVAMMVKNNRPAH